MKAFKAFRVDKNNNLLFLFHGLNGSRKVPTNTWITAQQKLVTDGSGARKYKSGFHVFLNEEEIPKWLRKTKLPSLILPVEVEGVRPKWSNKNIGVARKLLVSI